MVFESASLSHIDIVNLQKHLLDEIVPVVSRLPSRANGAITQPLSAVSLDPGEPDQQPSTKAIQRDRATRRSASVRFQIPCHCDEAHTEPRAALPASQNDETIISSLPSTVPETMEAVVMDRIEMAEGPSVEETGRESNVQRTQLSDATQPISQTAYDDVIRSRSEQASLPPSHKSQNADMEEAMGEDLQNSIQEGDPNFLDICSSYIAAPIDIDSVPVNFSPTQTQHPPSPFPESQRFKTPATAGRKRDRSGNFVDTPAESRNPFARSGDVMHGNLVGLSQAFANTQAGSSPLPVVPTSALRSDKPSPGIEIQRRVDDHATSSPLRPLTDPRRPSEPASKYVPVGQSQLLRMAMASESEENQATQGSAIDGFDSILSAVERQKVARERELRAREELEAASSPISPQKHNPLIVDRLPRRAESEKPQRGKSRSISRSKSRSLPSSPPPLESDETEEEETLEMVEDDDLLSIPAQPTLVRFEACETSSAPDESRRNAMMLVPDTTRRTTRSATQLKHSIQPSPSERRTRYARTVVPLDPLSSNPVRVANSQRSIPSTQEAGHDLIQPSLGESVDVIPASPDGQLQSTEPVVLHQQFTRVKQQVDPADEIHAQPEKIDSAAPGPVQSSGPPNPATVSETSSSDPTLNQQKDGTYTTAPTHQASDTRTATHEWSSQPVRTTPPGQKRKRLGDISQEEVPLVATQSSAFDPTEALALDEDPEVGKAFYSSQDPDPIQPRKRGRLDHEALKQRVEATETTSSGNSNGASVGCQLRNKSTTADDNELDAKNVVPSSSLSELPNTPNVQRTPSRKPPSRSIWSPGVSPQHKTGPGLLKARSRSSRSSLREVAAGRPNRPTSKTTLRTPKPVVSTLPSIEEASPDRQATAKMSFVTATTPAIRDEVVTPQMVFVYFMGQRRAYYPAICRGYSTETEKYTIVWPGYDDEHMARHCLCSLDLRIGDEVRVERENWPKAVWRIHGFGPIEQSGVEPTTIQDIYGHNSVMLEPKNAKTRLPKGVKKEDLVAISDIYMDSNQWGRVSKRPFVYHVSAGGVQSAHIPRPSTPQLRTSTPSTPSSRGRQSVKDVSLQPSTKDGIFSSMAFALSFGDEDMLHRIAGLVSDNGGTIVQPSFRELVTDTIHLKPRFSNTSFAVLLADKHSRKEKYMQALAMGLPCLSGKWIEVSVRRQKLAEWQDYLLPAGESDELDGEVRSRILAPMDMVNGKLSNILEHRSQPFAGANVIFVTGRGKTEVKRRTYLFLVRVMGATKIEEVVDLAAAELQLKATHKQGRFWLVVDDKDYTSACTTVKTVERRMSEKELREVDDGRWDCAVASSEFIVQSLILGRLRELDDAES